MLIKRRIFKIFLLQFHVLQTLHDFTGEIHVSNIPKERVGRSELNSEIGICKTKERT